MFVEWGPALAYIKNTGATLLKLSLRYLITSLNASKTEQNKKQFV